MKRRGRRRRKTRIRREGRGEEGKRRDEKA